MIIQELIEKSFYEAIRLRVVADGYTPDILTYPDTELGYQNYLRDLEAIRNDKGFAVEIFGMSNPKDKGYKNLARVVLITDSVIPGEYGVDPTPYYEEDENGNIIEIIPTQNLTYELYIGCSIVAEKTVQYRYLSSVVNSVLPNRGFLNYFDDSGEFFVELMTFGDNSDPQDQVMEYKYRYRVPDIRLTEDKEIGQAAKIKEINLLIQQRLGLLTSEETYIIQ